jgi:PIN domain nuclease of toxin-antitoxin system
LRLLLDTHSFLWFIAGSPRLSVPARGIIEASGNESFLSIASLWEMAIKASLGKLRLDRPFRELVPEQLRANGIGVLGMEVEHAATVVDLPFHHRDPFDRVLISQAIVERMPIVGADAAFDAYPVTRLW